MRRTPYESAAAPMSHSAADPAEFNAVCRSKSKGAFLWGDPSSDQ